MQAVRLRPSKLFRPASAQSPSRLEPGTLAPWTYLVTWIAGSFLQVSYALVDGAGNLVGQEVALTDRAGNGLQDYGYASNVVWNGHAFALAWLAYDPKATNDNPIMNTWFVRIDNTGQVVGEGTKLTPQPAVWLEAPTLNFTGWL